MVTNSRRVYGVGAVLLAVLAAPVGVRAQATAIPVPFPAAPVQPGGDELRSQLVDLQAFQSEADAHIRNVHAATESYRQYVVQVQVILASCEVDGDLEDSGQHPFASLIQGGRVQCREQVTAFDQQARTYAARLDEVVAFAERVEEAAESAQLQIDRINMMQRAAQLRQQVARGFEALDESREKLKPWMNP